MRQETGPFLPRRGTSIPKLILFLLEYCLPDTNGIILYDRLHAGKELATVPELIVNVSLKGEKMLLNNGGCWPWRTRSTWMSSSLPLKASSHRLRRSSDGEGEAEQERH
jgi:hypothetical protein